MRTWEHRTCIEGDRRICTLRRARSAVLLAVVGLIVMGCQPAGPLPGRLTPFVHRPQPRVVLFICDGVGWPYLERGCRDGRLPNIQTRFIEGGTRVEGAAAAVPPITYAAICTLLTGQSPAEHGIVANTWYDPFATEFRAYGEIAFYRAVNEDGTAPSVYERIQPRVSANVQTAFSRGVTRNFPNWAPSGVMWFFKKYAGVDRLTGNTIPEICDWANRNRRWPHLLTCYFPGADSVGHVYGPESDEYRAAVAGIDEQIGRVCAWLERQGLLATTHLVLVSDHGMVSVDPSRRVDLVRLVGECWGRAVTDRQLQGGCAAARRAYFEKYDTVITYQNGRGAFIHFRGPQGWGAPPSPEEVEAILDAPPPELRLWNQPGVALVAYLAGPDEAVLRSVGGETRIRRRKGADGPEYAYDRVSCDVLEYLAAASAEGNGTVSRTVGAGAPAGRPAGAGLQTGFSAAAGGPAGRPAGAGLQTGSSAAAGAPPGPPAGAGGSDLAAFVSAGYHNARAWLQATARQEIPDLVPHVIPLLHAPRAGQVLVFAAPGYSCVEERGGHGSVYRDEMLMNFLIAGPGIPAGGVVPVARATDVTPTLLDLLGVPYSEDAWLDAISLLRQGLLSRPSRGSVRNAED
ncbi:MAG: alkaline phosphatase family protein [Planctomycetota bacterium]